MSPGEPGTPLPLPEKDGAGGFYQPHQRGIDRDRSFRPPSEDHAIRKSNLLSSVSIPETMPDVGLLEKHEGSLNVKLKIQLSI